MLNLLLVQSSLEESAIQSSSQVPSVSDIDKKITYQSLEKRIDQLVTDFSEINLGILQLAAAIAGLSEKIDKKSKSQVT